MELIDKTLIEYIDQVDSDMPAPGGGSVASLVGALGVALAKMSAHFSVNKKKFKEAQKRVKKRCYNRFKPRFHVGLSLRFKGNSPSYKLFPRVEAQF